MKKYGRDLGLVNKSYRKKYNKYIKIKLLQKTEIEKNRKSHKWG